MATRPFLFIDLSSQLEKSWREEMHPRDKFGKFSTVKGGSRVVTKTGKTGVVQEVGDGHYKVRTDEGKLTKVAKDSVLHANDHKKVMDAQKADKKKKKATKAKVEKTKATKTATKANGTGKAKVIADPTTKAPAKKAKTASEAKKPTVKQVMKEVNKTTKERKKAQTAKVKDMKKKATAENKAIRQAKKKRDLEAPAIKRVELDPVKRLTKTEDNHKANQEVQDFNEATATKDNASITEMWESSKVQKLMSLPPEKRNAEDIKKLAGEITDANDKFARHLVLKRGRALGMNLASQINRIGNKATRSENVINQETGFYGDMLQSARATMFETLHNVMAGTQHPSADMGAHVAQRIKDKLKNDVYDFLNDIPLPHAVRMANVDMNNAHTQLSHELGRTPSDEELGAHLMKNSKEFKEAPIVKAPYWDDKKSEWVATNKQETDPAERVRQLRAYASQQKTVSADKNRASEEGSVTITSNIQDEGRSPEEVYERKERQKELEGTLPKAMADMGLSDDEIKLMTYKFSQPSEKRNQANLTNQEIADRYNAVHGTSYGEKWVDKWVRSAMGKIAQAHANNHPAIQQLAMLKSFVFNMILKSWYELNLIKSLNSWGLDASILRQKFTRVATGETLFDIKKSLSPTEYVGAYIVNDEGQVSARIVEHTLPASEELRKAFGEFEELQKSMFAHKGASNSSTNAKASEYAKKNKAKIQGMAKTQQERVKQKQGALTWSEELLVKNPGSAWISWGGKKILITGDGEIKYDSKNSSHREEQAKNHGITDQEEGLEFHHEEEELAEHRKNKEAKAHEEWAKIKDDSKKTARAKDMHMNKFGAKINHETGELEFNHGDEDKDRLDMGIQAFEEDLENLKDHVSGIKQKAKEHSHKGIGMYHTLSDEEKEAYDSMGDEERKRFVGHKILTEDVANFLQDKVEAYKQYLEENGITKPAKKDAENFFKEHKADFEAISKTANSMALRSQDGMSSTIQEMAKKDLSTDELASLIGQKEMTRAGEEMTKRMIPEGHYQIGNPTTGKSMVVQVAHRMDDKKNNYTSYISEAFDPETGEHFATDDIAHSWSKLNKYLGTNINSSEKLLADANKDGTSPMFKELSEDEAKSFRSQTRLGMQDEMTHKNFKLVDHDAKTGRKTFAQENEDGTQNVIEVDGSGKITDPIMARLLKQHKDVNTAEDLHEVMKNAVGNRAWVTAHAGSDVHIGDALGHHIELLYDGKGAPVVASGTYKGYRYIDSRDIPKGAVDPSTGEPIKALFKNGKLVDRKHTNVNDVKMKQGNAVMYQDGNTWKKGKITQETENGAFQVINSDGQLVGLFNKNELKPAKEKGRTLSNSGNAVLKVGQTGTHRMNTNDLFKPASEGKRDTARAEKAKTLFAEALKKAKINTTAFDKEGNLKKDLELNDSQMKRLEKVLGRSKAGKGLLKQFKSSYTKDLDLHVPEHLRDVVASEGVAVSKDGIAKVSTNKFEELRDILSREGSGISMAHDAQEHLADYFRSKDRVFRDIDSPEGRKYYQENYQPSQVNTKRGSFDDHYKAQFNPKSFLMDEKQGLYGTQLQGVAHLVERKRGIAGHGMGTGKTILGVVAHAHYKAKQLSKGQKPKKTLIVAPKGIMSDWGKEITDHTSMKGAFIGGSSSFSGHTKGEDGKKLWGQAGKEHEVVHTKDLLNNLDAHHDSDHDFHIMSYDTFMRNKDALTASGLYDNITIDEVHAFKNQGGKRGKSLAEATDKFKNVWGLSGTPMENDAREIHSLIDTISGGKHELGSRQEFTNEYMIKDRNGKIVGVNPAKAGKLGDILANFVQFRGGEDVKFNDGSKIHFPHLSGASGTPDNPNPQNDFVGNLVDRSRDHATNDYYGTKHSITDFDEGTVTAKAKSGEEYEVRTFKPTNMKPSMQKMYDEYSQLQEKYLPKSKLQELQQASTTGFDNASGKKSQNYLTAMQKLQKYLNAPLASKMYVPGSNAFDSEATGVQQTTSGDKKDKSEPIPFEVDGDGHKRYYESDGKGGYLKNEDGSPKLLAPLHHNNPKADYLKERVSKYLDEVAHENNERRKAGKPEIMPKLVVKSSYTTFGTDIVDGVLKDLAHPETGHPELHKWASKVGDKFGHGQFTGEATDREDTKVGFRGSKADSGADYVNNQGHLWATTVSPAGKEGVDFGNAHMMIHFDQDWNPQKMAQFTARVRRSDSWKSHKAVGRANTTRVESLHMPGTIEDFMFDAQDTKMKNISNVVNSTKQLEKQDKLSDTASARAMTGRGFSRSAKRKAGAKPKGAQNQTLPKVKTPKTSDLKVGSGTTQGKAVAKSLKLVIML
jgi:preprotein translocase subunit YajC